jgi:hypothetical protein
MRWEVQPVKAKVQISERALLQRLNRKLNAEGEIVKKTRPNSKSHTTLGDYYLLDVNKNFVVQLNLTASDLETMGRKNKVLNPWEVLEHSS